MAQAADQDDMTLSESDEVTLRAHVRAYVDEAKRSAFLNVAISAEPEAQPTWAATVAVLAHFTAADQSVIPLEQFVWSNGIANVVPYVRERLASLTSASSFPTFNLPPISVPALLALAGMVPSPPAQEPQDKAPELLPRKRRARSTK